MKMTRRKWTAIGLFVSLILIGAYIYLYTARLDIELIPGPNLSNGVTEFYVYNGTKTIMYSIWDAEIEKWLIEKMNDADIRRTSKPNSTRNLDYPIYAIEVSVGGGRRLTAAWWDGYWFCDTGEIYRVEMDFDEILDKIKGEDVWSVDRMEMPNSFETSVWYILTHIDKKWNKESLLPAPNPKGREYLEMELAGRKGNIMRVKVRNNSTAEHSSFYLGDEFILQVKLDGEWYYVPKKVNYAKFLVRTGPSVQGGKEVIMNCDMRMWGDIPQGTYRLMLQETKNSVEFRWNGR